MGALYEGNAGEVKVEDHLHRRFHTVSSNDHFMATITLHPSGRQFEGRPDENLLQSAMNAGVNLPYSCRAGHCGTCRGRVIEGETFLDGQADGIDELQRSQGYTLLCRSLPKSEHITIEIRELERSLGKPRLIPCRIKSVERVADSVAVVKLRLPMNEAFMFLPGQFIEILLPDGSARNYSIATPPSPRGVVELELHIRHRPGGQFTGALFNTDMVGKIMRIRAPLGSCYLREDSTKPMILLATGTGFAPIKSIVQSILQSKVDRSMVLYWGGRTKADLYMFEQVEEWARTYQNFRFVPVISRGDSGGWMGRKGHVHIAAKEDFPDMSGHQIYACGAAEMVAEARKVLMEERGVQDSDFFSDAFFPAC